MTNPSQTPPEPNPAQRYVGLTVEAAKELAHEEGRPLRVLKPGDLFTMEYIENRINVTIVDGVVIRATSG